LREAFQEQFNSKMGSLIFDNAEDGQNNFIKIVCVVADDVVGKTVRNIARNIM